MLKGLEFDDVLIKPIVSEVSSRDEVDIGLDLPSNISDARGEHLFFPLIASPMVGVVDGGFAKKLSDLGGLAILHRFYENEQDRVNDLLENLNIYSDVFGLAVKVNDPKYPFWLEYTPTVLLVDTANGYTKSLLQYCEEISNYISKNSLQTILMAGNVATRDGCISLNNAGCKMIRVGIGGGSPCSTRNVTGIGIPSITMLEECNTPTCLEEAVWRMNGIGNFMIVMDGGIKNSGDFVKAIVAGADLGMAGRLFGECFEAPNKGKLYGMASRTHMKNTNTEIKSVEGFDIEFDKKQSLEQFVREFGYGIKSAGTYLNAKNLDQMYMNGEFIEVTNTAIKKGI